MARAMVGYPLGMAAGRPARQPRTAFGERMAQAREQAGLTQAQLAARMGVTQPVVAYWEREPVALRIEQLAALADALDVSADYLAGRSTKPRAPKGPPSRLRVAFEKAKKLPRSQQQHILKVVEAFVEATDASGE
jgi:transcriptional regulator with XRE-family HTH domain